MLLPVLPGPCSGWLGDRDVGAVIKSLSLHRATLVVLHLRRARRNKRASVPPCTYSRLQWPNREWTFLQLSATSCPQAPPTSSPAPWAPVAWIATGNARAAPRTTSKAFGLVFLWLNLVSAHRHEHLGPLLSLLEEGILSVKRGGNERSNSRWPHSS